MKNLWEEILHTIHHTEFYKYNVSTEFTDKEHLLTKRSVIWKVTSLYIYNSEKNNTLLLIENTSDNFSMLTHN